MRYTVRCLFNGRARYYYCDNRLDAEYLFDVLKADIRNGDIGLWSGDTTLAAVQKIEGREVVGE